MRERYLEVTYRHGQAIAAYYYLPRPSGQKNYRTKAVEPGIVVDFSRAGRPIGIELTAPTRITLARMNRLLQSLGQPELRKGELSPCRSRRKPSV